MALLDRIHQEVEDESADHHRGIVNRKRQIVNPKVATESARWIVTP